MFNGEMFIPYARSRWIISSDIPYPSHAVHKTAVKVVLVLHSSELIHQDLPRWQDITTRHGLRL